MGNKAQVVILSGSNKGNSAHYLATALDEATKQLGVLTAVSSVYQSEPWGFEAPQHFLNQIWVFETKLSAHEVLLDLLAIETALGRTRSQSSGYQSRTIDLDIIYYHTEQIDDQHLTVPHPRMHERRFVLLPLVEVLPEFVHPQLGLSSQELLLRCTDNGEVTVYQRVQKSE